MTIRTDSGNLLLYIYKCKIEDNEMLDSNDLLNKTGWNKSRLNSAGQYLVEGGFVNGRVLKGLGSTKVQDVVIVDMTTKGIDVVEAQPEFKQNFGFTINLGLIQIDWGAQES